MNPACCHPEEYIATLVAHPNDVQRKNVQQEGQYGTSATFKSGHFQSYTIALNHLDGVYYCDIRPSMRTEPVLKEHIQTIDYFFCSDLWTLIESMP